jgi:hypothetical protein
MENNDLDTPRHREVPPTTPTYTLTVDEAAALFSNAGVPKNPRTISRNCEDGTLTCTKVETANFWRYMIDQGSVERRIMELKNVRKISVLHVDISSRDKLQHDASRHDEMRQDTSRHSSPDHDPEYIRNLEAQLKGLEIDKAVRDRSIQYLEQQLVAKEVREENFIEQLLAQSRLIGDMERHLHLLNSAPNARPFIEPFIEHGSPISDEEVHDILDTRGDQEGDNSHS